MQVFFDIYLIKKCDIVILLQSVTDSYYRVRQVLQIVTDCYYKVRQALQSVKDFITKCDSYYNVTRNKVTQDFSFEIKYYTIQNYLKGI